MCQCNTWFFIFGVFLYVIASQTNAIEITIKQGKLIGSLLESRNGTKYYAFLGIPYAKPPVGDLRFEPPQEADAWDGVRDATVSVPPRICVQKDVFTINASSSRVTGQEDCLYLNVYTPALTDDTSLPTMVYIHGGGFMVGAGIIYQPDYFLDEPVVVVTFNYRLGPIGFLSAIDEVLPGNYGMKDQVAALKWVQKNIAAFGGNANKVTIFGESAGGASVHYHMHSPLSTGLFHRAISQSGSALAHWAQTPPYVARQRARSFGLLSGCPVKRTSAMVNCLRKIPAKELTATKLKFYTWDFDPIIPFSVVVEPESVVDPFLVENPWKQEVVNNVPFIIGLTSGEGGIKAARYLSNNGALASEFNTNYKRIIPLMYGYGFWLPEEKVSQITESIKQFYFGDEEIGEKTAKQLVNLHSDLHFSFDCIEAAFRNVRKPYVYYYDHRNAMTFNEVFGNYEKDLGVSHSDDLLSLFYMPYTFPKLTKDADLAVSQRMVNYWTNFAKNGSPNGREQLWQPLQSEELEYLHITTKYDKMKRNLLNDRYKFWKMLDIIPPHKSEDIKVIKDEL